jgi:hypothetical protein
MTEMSDFPLDRLWREYSVVFRDFDDLSLARWMAQTLGQLQGRGWRLSHPLVGAYRLAAQVAADRQIWFKRLATIPPGYLIGDCCNAALLPLLTRDVAESGLVCLHCNETAVAFDDITPELQAPIASWAKQYAAEHRVAHLDENERRRMSEEAYERAFSRASAEGEKLLALAGKELVPKLAEAYTAAVWEDHDECLDIQPEDVQLDSRR